MIIPIAEPSQVGEARRFVAEAARLAGLNAERAGLLSLAATELATNLVKHGGGGQMGVERFDDADGRGIGLVAADKGPGMADVQRCLADGYSTSGTPGNGLGAVIRAADHFGIWSRPGMGTAVMARFVTGPVTHSGARLGAAVKYYPGEPVCGDQWRFADPQPGPTVIMADGSGHGAAAETAAKAAVQTFLDNAAQDGVTIMERIHRALQPTRGAAVAVMRVDLTASTVRYVGVGNISAVVIAEGKARQMISHNGTAGFTAPRIREFTYDFTGDPLVVMHSDGISAKWSPENYPGLFHLHPALVAAVLMRDHQRARDDATVVALRVMRPK